MAFTVYVMYSAKLDKYYVGHTEFIEARIEQHNRGLSTFTSKTSDWEIKYTEEFPSRILATLREKQIKAKKSRKYLEWLIDKID